MIAFNRQVRAIAPAAKASTIYGIYLSDYVVTNAGGLATHLNPGEAATLTPISALGLNSATLAYSSSLDPATATSGATLANASLHALANTNGVSLGCGGTCSTSGLSAGTVGPSAAANSLQAPFP